MTPNQHASLSVLTWKSPDTLRRTLESLMPLAEVFCERIVICQENDPREVELARQYGYRPVTTPHNVGIQEGLALAVSEATSSVVLVLENDCNYVGGPAGLDTLRECLALFQDPRMCVVKLRELPARPRKHYMKYWGERFPPRRTLIGMLRRKEADSCKAEAIEFENFDPGEVAEIEKISDTVFLTTSQYVSWTNRAFLVSRPFFLGTLLPFARSHPTSRLVNGYPDLEYAVNSPSNRTWWRNSKFKVGLIKPGLFGHRRYDRPDTDEKWNTGEKVNSLRPNNDAESPQFMGAKG